jgi:hypothetical protein
MKINSINLQAYQVDRAQTQQPHPELQQQRASSEAPKINSKFAQLLSVQEKEFIAGNFKAESSQPASDKHLGRVIDVRA